MNEGVPYRDDETALRARITVLERRLSDTRARSSALALGVACGSAIALMALVVETATPASARFPSRDAAVVRHAALVSMYVRVEPVDGALAAGDRCTLFVTFDDGTASCAARLTCLGELLPTGPLVCGTDADDRLDWIARASTAVRSWRSSATPHLATRSSARELREIARCAMARALLIASVMRHLGWASVLVLVVACAGCMGHGPSVVRTPPPLMPAVAFARHPTIFVSDDTLGNTAQATAFRARERELVARAGGTMVDERDAAGITPLPGDLILRFSQGTGSESRRDDQGDCFVWAAVLAPFSLGESFLACTFPWQDVSTRLPIEVRIFDATGVEVSAAVEGDERVTRIDTSDRAPILRAHYELVWTVHQPFTPNKDVTEELAYEQALGGRLAELFTADALPDLVRAESLVDHDDLPLQASDERTAGGEVPAPSGA